MAVLFTCINLESNFINTAAHKKKKNRFCSKIIFFLNFLKTGPMDIFLNCHKMIKKMKFKKKIMVTRLCHPVLN